MTTEDMIENFIQEVVKVLKRNYRNTRMYRALARHEDVKYQGAVFNYWKELAVFISAQWIKETYPDVDLEVNLEGNNSNLQISASEEDLRRMTSRLYVILKNSHAA